MRIAEANIDAAKRVDEASRDASKVTQEQWDAAQRVASVYLDEHRDYDLCDQPLTKVELSRVEHAIQSGPGWHLVGTPRGIVHRLLLTVRSYGCDF